MLDGAMRADKEDKRWVMKEVDKHTVLQTRGRGLGWRRS